MKIALIIASIIFVAVALVACGRKQKPSTKPTVYKRLPQDIAASKNGENPYAKVDADLLKKLVERINRNGNINDPKTAKPLLTLEEFFDGNGDWGSIGYNFYPDQPSPAEFYELLKGIRARPEVVDVRCQVQQHEEPERWPSTNLIWVITSATPEQVTSWLGKRFEPAEVEEGWDEVYKREPYDLPAGKKPISIFWH